MMTPNVEHRMFIYVETAKLLLSAVHEGITHSKFNSHKTENLSLKDSAEIAILGCDTLIRQMNEVFAKENEPKSVCF